MDRERLTYVVLGIFLILTGLAALISGFSGLGTIIAILAIAAGVMILIFHPDISNRIGWILAAIYLIVRGLAGLISFGFSGMDTILAVLALAAGIILLIKLPGFSHHIGFLLFCIWLILVGLAGFVSLGEASIVIAIVAIASGVLMILNE
jgi:hypothetical protein